MYVKVYISRMELSQNPFVVSKFAENHDFFEKMAKKNTFFGQNVFFFLPFSQKIIIFSKFWCQKWILWLIFILEI